MSGKVNFEPKSDVFSEYQKERTVRKVHPDALDQIFQKRRESPISTEVVDAVVEGASNDLFSGNDLLFGLNPNDKA